VARISGSIIALHGAWVWGHVARQYRKGRNPHYGKIGDLVGEGIYRSAIDTQHEKSQTIGKALLGCHQGFVHLLKLQYPHILQGLGVLPANLQ
jgi:hypothetical protein